MAGKKKWMGVHTALMMITTTLFAATVSMADDNAVAPAEKSQLNTWFNNNVKPYAQQKSTLDPALVKAEDGAKVVKVMQDGKGDYKKITDAINSIPAGNTKRVIVYIGGGVYNEKITIPRNKPFVTLYGEPNKMPNLTYSGTAAQYGTVNSATLVVESDYFTAVNLVIKNSSPRPDGKRVGAQAVALRVSGTKAALYNCRMFGFQDTICDDRGYHFFKDCYVEGTVDFIFGSGKSLYLNSQLHVLGDSGMTVIAAQARDSNKEDTGYSFVHCNVTGTGSGTFLGRAWRASPQVVYAYTSMGKVVNPEGWSDSRHPEYDSTVYYGEYKCLGPGSSSGGTRNRKWILGWAAAYAALNVAPPLGSSITGRVKYTKQLSDAEAKPFITLGYIQGSKWLLPPPNPKV